MYMHAYPHTYILTLTNQNTYTHKHDVYSHVIKRQPTYKFLCLNASFFSTNDEVTREQRQQLTQAEECELLLWDTS